MTEATKAEAQEVDLRGKRILVVDDEDPVRDVFGRIFTRQGSVVFSAKSGEEALEIFQREKANGGFELVVTDKDMDRIVDGVKKKGMSGIELSRELIKEGFSAPIILASGALMEEAQNEALRAGVKAVMAKPFPLSDLVAKAKQVLSK